MPGGMEPLPVLLVPLPVEVGMPVVGEVIDKEIYKRVEWGVDEHSTDQLEDNIRWEQSQLAGRRAHNLLISECPQSE